MSFSLNLVLICAVLLTFANSSKLIHKSEVSSMLDDLLQGYDSRLRPAIDSGRVNVNITILIDNIGPISETDMNFRLDFAMRQMWHDERLQFNSTTKHLTKPLSLNNAVIQKLWVPDIFFPESLSSQMHNVMAPNTLLRLFPNGDILYSSRVTIVSKCAMDLSFFPLDIQKCGLLIESYGYTTDEICLKWHDIEPVALTNRLEIAQFELINFTLKSFSLHFSTGNFSDLEIVFLFKRGLTYFILQQYLPSTLIVMLSWISFWVNRDCVPARAALSITTVLTMITLMGTTNSNLPKVSDVKALDVHFAICLLYVFGALIEFAVVCYFNKPRYSRRTSEMQNLQTQLYLLMEFLVKNKEAPKNGNCKWSALEGEDDTEYAPIKVEVSKIDFYSRIAFPGSYIILALFYWIGYTNSLHNQFTDLY